jgi:hypothetical protein
MKPIGKKLAGAVVAGLVAALAWQLQGPGGGAAGDTAISSAASQHPVAGDEQPAADAARLAYEQRARGRQLLVQGRVQRTLADDREGSPHQRFIIVTDSGQSLLVAHNLDLAPRLEGLAAGEPVVVYGEYEWNEQGGVMHWTHDDPQGMHPAGFIEWRGRRYQ